MIQGMMPIEQPNAGEYEEVEFLLLKGRVSCGIAIIRL